MPLPAFVSSSLMKYVGLPVLAMFILAAYTGATFYFGYDYSEKATRAALADEYEQDLADIRMRWIDDRAKIADLQARLTQDVRKVETIIKEVPKYVTPDKNEFCGPPIGIVRLLNDARNLQLPLAARELDAESRSPSGIDYTEQVQDTIGITQRYNELMLRYNALVKWIEDNYAPADRSRLRGNME